MSDLLALASFGLSAFAAIFTIVNPVGNLSFFVTLTQGYPDDLKRRVARRVVNVSLVVLLLFALAGNYIFLIFHTTIHAFRIAGGILLFSIAFSMLQGERSRVQLTERERDEALHREAVGVVPLGVPMFAGPGAITTAMVLMAEASVPALNVGRVLLVFASILLTLAISYALLRRADAVAARFGRMGMMAFSRIMGLILAAIAVQFVILGIQGAWLEFFVGAAP